MLASERQNALYLSETPSLLPTLPLNIEKKIVN